MLQFLQAATCNRLAPFAIVITQINLIVGDLAILPVLVIARRNFKAIHHTPFAQRQRELMRTGFHRLIAFGAKPGAWFAVKSVFQHMTRFFGWPVQYQNAVSGDLITKVRRFVVAGGRGKALRAINLYRETEWPADIGFSRFDMDHTIFFAAEIPAAARFSKGGCIWQCFERLTIQLDCIGLDPAM